MSKVIAIASDHAGFKLKNILAGEIAAMGHKCVDLGTNSNESVDYPDFGYMLAEEIASGRADMGVAICGSGIGISIALNRNKKVRAALCHNVAITKLARQHNNANTLVLGARFMDTNTAKKCLKAFVETEFEGGRHKGRVEKLGG